MSWTRVSKSKPCAICGKPDWCTRNEMFHACTRIHDAPGRFKLAKNGASLYWIDPSRPTPKRAPPKHGDPPPVHPDIGSLADVYARNLNGELYGISESLGVSCAALGRLGAGWDGEAATFPMYDAERRCIGIRRRFPDGRKLSVAGGHEGVFLPEGFPESDDVLICEGPTDTAAALTLGFEALGRPSCRGAVEITKALCSHVRCVIVADADVPGQSGAKALAEQLRGAKVVTPPKKHKDIRGWVRAGLKRDELTMIIRSTR